MPAEEVLIRVALIGGKAVAVELGEVDAGLTRVGRSADRSSKSLGSSSGGLAGAFKNVRSMLGIGSFVAVAASMYEGVKSAAAFRAQMLQLQTQTGATAGEVKRMTAGVMGMAVSVGTGPQTLAEGLYHIESSGIRGAKALDLLRIASEGAGVGGANLTDVTTALIGSVVSGIPGVHGYTGAMGALNATVGAGDMTMQDLADAMSGKLTGTIKTAGLSINDLGAALAVLGDNNIRGAAAGTILRGSISKLAAPSAAAKEAMAGIGLGPQQLANDMRKPDGLLVALDDLKSHLGALTTNAEKSSAMAQLTEMLGGSKNAAGVLTLINQLPRLTQKYADVKKGQDSFAKSWQTYSHSLPFYMKQAEALAQVLFIKLGNALGHVVTWIQNFVNALEHGKTWAIIVAAVLGGLVGGLALLVVGWMAVTLWTGISGGALLIWNTIAFLIDFVQLASEIGMVGDAWKALAFSEDAAIAPWLIIAIAIGLLIAGFVLLYLRVGFIRNALNAFSAFMIKIFKTAIDFVINHWKVFAVALLTILLGPLGLIIGLVATHFNAIEKFVEKLPGRIAKAATGLWDGLKKGLVSTLNWAIGMLNVLIRAADKLPFVNIKQVPLIGGGGATTALGASNYKETNSLEAKLRRQIGAPGTSASLIAQDQQTLKNFGAAPGIPDALNVHTHVHIDGRQVGVAIAQVALRQKANR